MIASTAPFRTLSRRLTRTSQLTHWQPLPVCVPFLDTAPSTSTLNGWRVMKKSTKSRPRPTVPDYCNVEPQRDHDGNIIWPAPEKAMEEARAFIREWYAQASPLSEQHH